MQISGLGAGPIAVSLLAENPDLLGIGVDISLDALQTARLNAERHNVYERLLLVEGNNASPVIHKIDLIVANLPYIVSSDIKELEKAVKDYDPLPALDGGADGLAAFRNLFEILSQNLMPPPLLLEVGNKQAQSVCLMFSLLGYNKVEVSKDLQGHERIISCTN